MSSVLLLLAFCSSVFAQGILHLNEGDLCKDSSPPWYCRPDYDCPGLKEAIKRRQFPRICSFRGRNKPIICCPPLEEETAPQTTTTSRPYWPSWSRPSQTTANVSPSTTPEPPSSSSPQEATSKWPSWTRPSQPVTEEDPNREKEITTLSSLQSMNDATIGLKAERKCKEYEKYVWKTIKSPVSLPGDEEQEERISFCGRVVQPLIVGGEDARPREFPHMARIGYGEKPRIQWLCGGSLISERFILSAAHCTKPAPNRLANWANLGELDASTDTDEADPVTIRIIERIDHPGYTGKELYNDIALYKLQRDAPLGIYIRPICLNTKGTIPQPKAYATGWGHTSWGGHGSARLQKVDLDLVTNKRCNDSYQSNIGIGLEIPRGILAEKMICAGGAGKKDTCQGDSGGPLQIPLATPYCMYAIIGVTSFGKGCATNNPGVYSNVAHYVKWIENIVWPT